MTINPVILNGIEAKRRLDAETLDRLGVSTGRAVWQNDHTEVIPDPAGTILIFPLRENGQTVGEKYRAPGKRFWQKPGGKRTFINADVLDDPQVEQGQVDVTITEGEFDMATAVQCGFPFTMSVPDGAVSVPDGEDPEALGEQGDDSDGKFSFLWNNRDKLKRVRRFILAMDNDPPGIRMAAELKRRFSAAKCSHVTYPEGCKDLNDVLMHYGPEQVSQVLNEAQPYPVRGLYKLSDYPAVSEPKTYSTGWDFMDNNFTFYHGALVPILGVPGMGKSTWAMGLCAQLAECHGMVTAMASFEASPAPYLRDMLRHHRLGVHRQRHEMYPETDAWIDQHFSWIDAEIEPGDEDVSVDWILEKAEDCLYRYGLDVLVIDPWNEMDHYRRPGQSETEYTGHAIKQLKRFARTKGVTVFVLVHPTKEIKGKNGEVGCPHPYDAAGSAHWFNKADQFISLHRPDITEALVEVHIQKAKFRSTGKPGTVEMSWRKSTGRFAEDVNTTGSRLV